MPRGTTALLRRIVTTAILLSCLCMSAPATAEEPATATDVASITDQLAEIRGELKAIVRLLGNMEANQRVSALMTRIRLKQQRLGSIESSLNSGRSQLTSLEVEIERMTQMEEQWQAESEGFLEEGLSEEERLSLQMLRTERNLMVSRVEALRPRIVELENDFAQAQADIRALEETVDEQLGLR